LKHKVLSMKTEQEYIKDLTEIRSMMERSSKFLTLTGWPGIMAGVYALGGAFIGYRLFYHSTEGVMFNTLAIQEISANVWNIFLLGLLILTLAVGTAIYIPYQKAKLTGDKIWNAAARRMVTNMAIPLLAGGIFILIIFFKGLLVLVAPLTLIFYGLALINASKYTYDEVRLLGLVQIGLGLLATYFIGYGLLFWALGFGVVHIIYGLFMHLNYEK